MCSMTVIARIETSSIQDRYRATKPMIISHQINSLSLQRSRGLRVSVVGSTTDTVSLAFAPRHIYVRSFTRPTKRKDPGTGERFGKMTKIYQLRSTVNDQLGSSRAVSPIRRNPYDEFPGTESHQLSATRNHPLSLHRVNFLTYLSCLNEISWEILD